MSRGSWVEIGGLQVLVSEKATHKVVESVVTLVPEGIVSAEA